jgi:hypothetical protein
MTNTTAVSDLTTPVPWAVIEGKADASSASFDVAVPSSNLGAEPQRLDATRAQITARLIRSYVDREKEQASLNYRGARQDIEPISRAPTNEKRNDYWTAPVVRRVNWTRANTFSALQEWEGVVVAITPNHIVASLVDLTAGKSRATEEAHIPLSEINERDLAKLVVGRVFRWAIGYQRIKTGTKKRTSNMVFRDLPQWTKRDFVEAQADAARLMGFLGSDESRAEAPVADSG